MNECMVWNHIDFIIFFDVSIINNAAFILYKKMVNYWNNLFEIETL